MGEERGLGFFCAFITQGFTLGFHVSPLKGNTMVILFRHEIVPRGTTERKFWEEMQIKAVQKEIMSGIYLAV